MERVEKRRGANDLHSFGRIEVGGGDRKLKPTTSCPSGGRCARAVLTSPVTTSTTRHPRDA
jgi:hypothetical protein